MISILIPVFNFDIRQLVADLVEQCEKSGVNYEVLCFDDGSNSQFKKLNASIASQNVIYKEMSENLGRSAIRNVLGKAAKFSYLMFMDCDSKVVHNDFVAKYLTHLQPDTLLYGGRCYSEQAPAEKRYLLHWKYGKNREESSPKERAMHPWHSFMTNNFVVPKNIFSNILFDESLKQYGHEDTIFGLELKKQNTKIIHLDNPLEHIGLENTEVFIKKSEQALENLYFLYQKNPLMETKLLNLFSSIKKKNIISQIGKQYYFLRPIILKQLHSKYPSLKLFDFYKLLFFSHLELKHRNLMLNEI